MSHLLHSEFSGIPGIPLKEHEKVTLRKASHSLVPLPYLLLSFSKMSVSNSLWIYLPNAHNRRGSTIRSTPPT
ncbi:hypothetical protein GmHk_05G014374 [Glycine max]|nr:hypothetical protein GmHk_05G014374 [Glycine max]